MSRSTSKTQKRQSDLQPVYDVLDALHPTHLKAGFNRLNRRTRWIIVISAAVIALMWSALMLVQIMVQHVRNTTGPFLFEALAAPYELDARLIPGLAGEIDLPPVIAGHSRIGNPVSVSPDSPVVAPAEDTEGESKPLRSAISECIWIATVDGTNPSNCAGSNALYAVTADYQAADGNVVSVSAARFITEPVATEVMNTLYTQATAWGRTGNFAIGVTPVDFFYSSASGLYSFTWSNSVWVYTVFSSSYEQMESFVKAFPY